MNKSLYTLEQVEAIAALAAKQALVSTLDLDNEIYETVADRKDNQMPRQRVHVTLSSGETVWITGATFSDLIQNALRKYGNYMPEEPNQTETFREYTDNIYEVFLRPRWKDSTENTNKFLLNKHILPYFGSLPLNEITTTTVQNFFQTKSNLSKSYTKQMLIILHEILENAVEDGKLAKDPTASKRITLPDKATKREALTAEQFRDITSHLSVLDEQDALLLSLLCFTGMRRGEVLGLKWKNVTETAIQVRSEVTYKSNQPVFHEYTKSKSGIRDISIPDELKPYLANKGRHFVIGNAEAPITQSKFDRAWQRIGKKINLYGATPHVFRHTYLSMLVASGVDPKTVQTIAGHADFNFTFNRYIHKNEENVAEASTKLSEKLAELTQKLTKEDTVKSNNINASRYIETTENDAES